MSVPEHSTTYTSYQNPLIERYSSREMAQWWGPERRFQTWRSLWIALAESEKELGLPISEAQIEQLRAFRDQLNLDVAKEYERVRRHDVMAHVEAYGDQCPDAKPIIHLGATSCFVTDNADLILIRGALQMVAKRLAATIDALGRFADRASCPALPRLHPPATSPANNNRQAMLTLGVRLGSRSSRNRAPSGTAAGEKCQRDDRHPSQFSTTLWRRPRKSKTIGAKSF